MFTQQLSPCQLKWKTLIFLVDGSILCLFSCPSQSLLQELDALNTRQTCHSQEGRGREVFVSFFPDFGAGTALDSEPFGVCLLLGTLAQECFLFFRSWLFVFFRSWLCGVAQRRLSSSTSE